MTTNDIDAIRQREQAADSGPWRVVEEHGRDIADEAYHRLTVQTAVRYGESREIAEMVDPDHSWSSKLTEENAEFIAHARADVPALLAKVDELTAENLRLREQVFAQKPVIDAALAWAEMCEDGGLAPDDCRKSEDALLDAVESYRLMDLALTNARDEAGAAA